MTTELNEFGYFKIQQECETYLRKQRMNEFKKPNKCSETNCNNKAYKKDYINRRIWTWVCRKHYKQYQ